MEDNNRETERKTSYADYYKSKNSVDSSKENETYRIIDGNIIKYAEKGISDNLKKAINEAIKIEEKAEEKVEKEIEKDFHTDRKTAKRIERIIIAVIFIVVLGILAYFLIASFFPDTLPFDLNNYIISADDSKIFNSLNAFYIEDSSVLGDKQVYLNETIRPIISGKKFNLVFKPKTAIQPTNATLSLSLVMFNNSNVYLNDELIFPNLQNYDYIYTTPDYYDIYARKDLVEQIDQDNLTDEDTAPEFLYKNFPSSSAWATSAADLEPINPIVDDYNQTDTLINTTFRGDLHLAVYAKDNLMIDFTKQDLNWYLGADEYTVNVTDYAGNIIFSQTYPDDGIKEAGSLGKEQNFTIKLENLTEGVYYVNFVIDTNNQYTDVSVKNIRINSNKLIVLGNNLPIEPFSFYTKIDSQQSIGFNYWHSGKNQLINITGTQTRVIDLNESWISMTYTQNLTQGEYNFHLGKGDINIYSDFISPSKENWFNIPSVIDSKFNNQDFLVIDEYIYDNFSKSLEYQRDIKVKGGDKIGLRALENGAVGIKSINLELE